MVTEFEFRHRHRALSVELAFPVPEALMRALRWRALSAEAPRRPSYTASHVVPELAHEAAERMGDALWS